MFIQVLPRKKARDSIPLFLTCTSYLRRTLVPVTLF